MDDDNDILIAGKLLLRRFFTHVETCNQPQNIPNKLLENNFDAILLDMNFGPGESSGEQGFFWLKRIIEINPQAVIIMITAHGGVNVVVEAMKLGATDFIAKPWQNEKLVATLSSAVQLGKSRIETKELKDKNQLLTQVIVEPSSQKLLGHSKVMQNVMSLIERSAPTDANVLILGENGTGKELIARELHRKSHRADQIFMSVDLGALSEGLFESELFGYKKGAFTGANHERIGRLLAANGGTLFLDEIGNVPLHLQAKLLTVLEQRKVTPLGANQAIEFDVRVISATNLTQQALGDNEKFRQDLLFRLNTVEIIAPPLKDRHQDIEEIANYYARIYCKKYQKVNKTISPTALESLRLYHWPGNVRALKHAMERAIILSQSEHLEVNDFQLEVTGADEKVIANEPLVSKNKEVSDAMEISQTQSEDLNLARLEKQTIVTALRKHRYNISHSAKELGLTRTALYRRMEKYEL